MKSWISANDVFPSDFVDVLALSKEKFVIAHRYDKSWFNSESHSEICVDLWAHLPEIRNEVHNE